MEDHENSPEIPEAENSVPLPEESEAEVANNSKGSRLSIDGALSKIEKIAPGSERLEKTRQLYSDAKNIATGVQQFASSVHSSISAFVATVTNPVFWVVLGVAILVFVYGVGLYSASMIIGSNENAKGCGGVTGNAQSISNYSTGDSTDAANKIGTWLMTTPFALLGNKPMSKEQAAAFIGNWRQESNLNPTASNGNVWSDSTSNQEIEAIGTVGAPATGLVQWTADRRLNMVKKADSMSLKWNDINAQLAFFKDEFDGGEGKSLVDSGFTDSGKTAKDLSGLVVSKYERSGEGPGDPGYENRLNYSDAFMKDFTGGTGAGTSTGGSCTGNSANSFDNSGIVNMALSIVAPNMAAALVQGSDIIGESVAPQVYKDAKAKADTLGGPADTWYDGHLYASCDRFVTTVMRNTVDPQFPWIGPNAEYDYMKNNPKYQMYTNKSDAKPGDVWVTVPGTWEGITSAGHVLLYIGDHDGQDSVAEASFYEFVGVIDPASYYVRGDQLADSFGRPFVGFHYVG